MSKTTGKGARGPELGGEGPALETGCGCWARLYGLAPGSRRRKVLVIEIRDQGRKMNLHLPKSMQWMLSEMLLKLGLRPPVQKRNAETESWVKE